jgi:hypothetical protein
VTIFGREGSKLGFPSQIIHFSDNFSRLQEERHKADYDPYANYIRADVLLLIEETEFAIKQFKQSKIRDRTAYTALVLLKNRANSV